MKLYLSGFFYFVLVFFVVFFFGFVFFFFKLSLIPHIGHFSERLTWKGCVHTSSAGVPFC